MARTARRRRRKHRGTQSGSIDRRGRTSRPRSRQEARARARKQLSTKREGPPTWGSALRVALLASGFFFLVLVIVFKNSVGSAIAVAALMGALYTPIAHAINRFQYNRRQAAGRRERERRARGE